MVAERHGEQEPAHGRHGHAAAAAGEEVLEVHAAQPHDLSGAPSRSENVKFVLELNRNGFREMGIRMGDRMDLKEISGALRARGLDPSKYGLP